MIPRLTFTATTTVTCASPASTCGRPPSPPRPAMYPGWSAEFDLQVNLPEYFAPSLVNDLLVDAGRLIGIGDFRPTFGRFSVTHFEVLTK